VRLACFYLVAGDVCETVPADRAEIGTERSARGLEPGARAELLAGGRLGPRLDECIEHPALARLNSGALTSAALPEPQGASALVLRALPGFLGAVSFDHPAHQRSTPDSPCSCTLFCGVHVGTIFGKRDFLCDA
jgi:hypothetical protein